MVISRQKSFDAICAMLRDAQKLIVTGCSECASICRSGGAPEVEAMKLFLEKQGKTVLATKVLTTSCNVLYNKKELDDIRDAVSQADAILCMACGDGVQTVAKVSKKPTFPANDTLFIGETVRNGIFLERCEACGNCRLGDTAAICPVTACGKSLLNGPCGGSVNGMCEVVPDKPCAWILIYKKMLAQGKEECLTQIPSLPDYRVKRHPMTINLRDEQQ